MLAEVIVAFREFFEISLLVGVMLAYLEKTGNAKYSRAVLAGAAAAGAASVACAVAFQYVAGGFAAYEGLFEGVALIVSAVLVTWLILWMFAQASVTKQVERGLKQKIGVGTEAGVSLFSFVAVFREGIEIVLFLWGISISSGQLSVAGAALGAIAAVALCYLVFASIVRLDFKAFFKVTSALLILLAAGLLSQGVHELEEAGVLPPIIEHVYDVTPPRNAGGTYPLMHEKGLVGGVLKATIGYDTNPSLLQALAYFSYLLIVCLAYLKVRVKV